MIKKYRGIIRIIFILVMIFNLSACTANEKKEEAVSTITAAALIPSNEVEDNTDSSEEIEESQAPAINYEVVFTDDFESGNTDFVSRGGEKTEIVDTQAYEGTHALQSSGRTDTWNGPKIDLSQLLTAGKRFQVSTWVKYEDGDASNIRIYCKLEKNASEYLAIGSMMANKGEWSLLEGEIEIPFGTDTAALYFETEYKSAFTQDDLVNIYIDNVKVTEVTANMAEQTLPSLKEAYKDYFVIGVAVGADNLLSADKITLIKNQFNSITMGNEMKAENILDYSACVANVDQTNEYPALNFDKLDIGLKFAQDNGIALRGHTLVWHSQTPSWFFKEDYSKDSNAPLASKDVMLKRLENYIKQVLEYTQENYQGVVYAWDVVNEAILTGDGEKNGYRVNDSLWYQTIGPEYVEKAFEYARKYVAPGVKLIYNDFNTYEANKRLAIYNLAAMLKKKGLIDGIGMQSHIKMSYPSLVDYQVTLTKFAELGLEIQITELDMDLETNSEDDLMKQAMRYKRLFTILKKLKDEGTANITSVTFWGLSDDGSWLNDDTPSYPLLFDKYLQAKKSFWGVLLDDTIPLY